jgi:putative restriction endonuclease
MGRTASSLALKLVNFASLDPIIRASGKTGMPGASKADQNIWDEFQQNLLVLGPQSEELLHDLFTKDQQLELDLLQPDRIRTEPAAPIDASAETTEYKTTVLARRGQQFFRQSVLNAYGVRCCISGIDVAEFLVASHIRPWKDFPKERLNPNNGLCLSSLHDRAFDKGLITLDQECRVVLSRRLRAHLSQSTLECNFTPFEGVRIRMPEKLAEPSSLFLAYHRDAIFEG